MKDYVKLWHIVAPPPPPSPPFVSLSYVATSLVLLALFGWPRDVKHPTKQAS